jgi:peptide-methionine (R)-S-oxide reductase
VGTERRPLGLNREAAIRPAVDARRGHEMNTTGKDYAVEKTDEQWRAELTPEQYKVLREAGTERAWTGELLDESRSGLYTCAACNAELFKSGTKFDSGCGWPSFYDSVNPDAVELLEDRSLGVVRTEVRCANCGSHLGHVFDDGFGTPTGLRYCMNSLSLGFHAES